MKITVRAFDREVLSIQFETNDGIRELAAAIGELASGAGVGDDDDTLPFDGARQTDAQIERPLWMEGDPGGRPADIPGYPWEPDDRRQKKFGFMVDKSGDER